jgi:hypothetical protein
MCNCKDLPDLLEISNCHAEFKARLSQIKVGNWVLLMSCPSCGQLWKVDEWDKYQNCYAAKISTQENWESFSTEELIKAQIVKNHGGFTNEKCMWSGCSVNQVNGSAFCVNHLYAGGTRA